MRHRHLDFIVRGVAVIALTLQSLAGLCGDNCAEPGVSVGRASVTEGVTHARKGEQEGDFPVTADIAESGTCSLWATLSSATPDGSKGALGFLFDDPKATEVTGYFKLDVQKQADDDSFSVSITTSDPRGWSALGEVPAADVAASVHVVSYESCTGDGNCASCELDVPDASVRFVVVESAGAADDSQNRVSDDFQRKLTLELDLGGPVVPISRDGDACADIEMSGSVTFSWSSADFVWTDCPL